MGKKYKYRELIELKGLLRTRKYTYDKMAKELGISTSAFCDKINGVSSFLLDEAKKIITILNISEEDVYAYFF